MSDAVPFSVLLPVYAGDEAAHFERAFRSAVQEQTRRPAQVVVVQDGPVPGALADAIAVAVAGSPVPVVHEVVPENRGLAHALTVGLALCAHDVVARMDADDISLPERFERQLPLIEAGVELVGSGLYEFTGDGDITAVRTPPVGHDEISAFARFHDPFNHPTVVYRRAAVLSAGGYRPLELMEDYWLFARMIRDGARVDNVAEPLVMYRTDSGSYSRRGGWRLFRSELALQRHLYREGFIGTGRFLRNVLVRGGYRFVPVGVRKFLYQRVFATKTSS
ncbi:glycosyltransferase [Mycetocola reblochoni]|uniref:Glycosyltransferase n=2 Tax=Mycetocola reblochoni TaxID=331618 RepID=A0A3L6ZRB5_9MICO|nr:glycosyltransferase [Mycetocola reblochoni]RLP70476.1 glycosyltransferase [Mycetocola reblochoni]SJN37814.1 putative glycosyltransferase [Mycetocola reblochoni REB411]